MITKKDYGIGSLNRNTSLLEFAVVLGMLNQIKLKRLDMVS